MTVPFSRSDHWMTGKSIMRTPAVGKVLEGTSGEAVAKGGPGGVVADEHRDLDFVGELASVVDDFTRRSPIKRINHLNLFLRKPELGRN